MSNYSGKGCVPAADRDSWTKARIVPACREQRQDFDASFIAVTLVAIPAIRAQSLIGSEFFAERNDHNPSVMFALCHQIPQRSFLWLWDPPWLCARCTGFYFAIVVALLLFALRPRWGNTWAFRVAAAGVLAAGAIGLEKFLALELGNWGRCLIALPVGFAVGLGLVLPFISRRYQGVSQ